MGFQFQSLASVSPLLVREFGIVYADIGFLIGLYMLPGIALALPGGALGRRFGDKRVVAVGLILMAVGGALSGFAETYPVLVAGRLLSGVGATLLPVGVIMALPAEVLRPESRAIGMGLFYTWLYIGHAGLPPAAGWIQDLTGKAAAPIYFAGALVLSTLLLFALARRLQTRALQSAPLSA
jgi:MFS family permease